MCQSSGLDARKQVSKNATAFKKPKGNNKKGAFPFKARVEVGGGGGCHIVRREVIKIYREQVLKSRQGISTRGNCPNSFGTEGPSSSLVCKTR